MTAAVIVLCAMFAATVALNVATGIMRARRHRQDARSIARRNK